MEEFNKNDAAIEGNVQVPLRHYEDKDGGIAYNGKVGLLRCKILPKIDRKSILRRYYFKSIRKEY